MQSTDHQRWARVPLALAWKRPGLPVAWTRMLERHPDRRRGTAGLRSGSTPLERCCMLRAARLGFRNERPVARKLSACR